MTTPSRLAAMSGTAWKPLLACACALALTGCGGDSSESTLTQDQARLLESDLTQVEDNFEEGRCDDAAAAARDLVQSVNELPADAGETLKAGLRAMAENLEDLADRECEEDPNRKPKPEPEPVTTAPTVAPTTETETTETTETSEDEEEEDEQEEEEEEQPEEPDTTEPQPPSGAPGGQQGAPGNSGGSGGTGGIGQERGR